LGQIEEELKTEVGEGQWLGEARQGHQMRAGPLHRRGKFVIKVAGQWGRHNLSRFFLNFFRIRVIGGINVDKSR